MYQIAIFCLFAGMVTKHENNFYEKQSRKGGGTEIFMSEKELATTGEMLETIVHKFTKKAHRPYKDMILLGFLAGVFIALAGAGADMAAHNLLMNPATTGLGKFVSGIIFPVGLMLVVFGGTDLFTSNCLVFTGVLAGKVKPVELLVNWVIIYLSNFAGALMVAFLFFQSGEGLSRQNGLWQDSFKSCGGDLSRNFM